MIRVLFFGTSDFAVPSLEALAQDERFTVVAVVTQPDRAVGRHAKVTEPPIKIAAEKFGIPVLQFERVKSDEAFAQLMTFPADVGVVISFGQIIPDRILNLSVHGCINVHGSLLPKYRGASPIQAAIKNGDAETGITIMKMDAQMDHGPLLTIARESIRADDTGESLHDRLALLGAKTLPDAIVSYLSNMTEPVEQDHTKATYVKLLTREDGLIDWTLPAKDIEQTVRAYHPWPGTYTIEDGKRLKILSVSLPSLSSPSSSLFPIRSCGDGRLLQLLRVQPEGKPPMDGDAYLRGRQTLKK